MKDNMKMEAGQTKFSIIIPTYNRGYCILNTINSVLEQSFLAYEIIVVDNCSTDNTEEVLGDLIRSNKIKYIRHSTNLERAASRNTGMENATGDFVSFLDSDDFLYATCLEDANEFGLNNSEIKVFHCKYELINKVKKPIYQYEFPSLKNQYKALASGNFMSNIGGFLHKEVYKQFRFNTDPKMVGSEDYLMWFSIFARYKVGRIDKINCGILEHENRSVNLGVYQNLGYQKDIVINEIKDDPITFSKFKAYMNLLESSFCLQMSITHNGVNKKGAAIKMLWESFKIFNYVIFTKRFSKILYNIILK